MKWPKTVTPFHVAIINLGKKNDEQSKNKAEKIYELLKENAFDVLLDDTDESPASKFKNFDLIGIPYQIVVGSKLDKDDFEFKEIDGDKEILKKEDILKKLKNIYKID
jgi:prolyl-tRNA synthetase